IFRPEEAAIATRARTDINALTTRLEKQKSDFVSTPGWQIVVVSSPAGVTNVEGFDPMNISLLGPGQILHQRWIKLTSNDGSVEVLNHSSLSNSGASSPFEGVKQLTITGLEDRSAIVMSGGTVRVSADGALADLRHASVHTEGQKVFIAIGQQPASSAN